MSNLTMVMKEEREITPKITVEKVSQFKGMELSDLCDATEATMNDTYGFSIGFNRAEPPVRNVLESYFKGVLIIPERQLIVGRYDGTIAGSIQLVKPGPSNQTSSFACSVDNHFVAPWARGYGMAKMLLEAAEEEARNCGFTLLKLSVRATREAAIKLYESCGYIKWGTLDKYEFMAGKIVAGHFYYKDL
jgi:ribosomal protein S18 acetylase RimI-like enzyme